MHRGHGQNALREFHKGKFCKLDVGLERWPCECCESRLQNENAIRLRDFSALLQKSVAQCRGGYCSLGDPGPVNSIVRRVVQAELGNQLSAYRNLSPADLRSRFSLSEAGANFKPGSVHSAMMCGHGYLCRPFARSPASSCVYLDGSDPDQYQPQHQHRQAPHQCEHLRSVPVSAASESKAGDKNTHCDEHQPEAEREGGLQAQHDRVSIMPCISGMSEMG
jgi:hypothetical protein